MDAKERCAPVEGGDRGPDRRRVGRHPRARPARDTGERRLPREAHEHGPADPDDPVEAPYELEVLVGRLAEPDTRVEADALLGNACRHGVGEPLLEEEATSETTSS